MQVKSDQQQSKPRKRSGQAQKLKTVAQALVDIQGDMSDPITQVCKSESAEDVLCFTESAVLGDFTLSIIANSAKLH